MASRTYWSGDLCVRMTIREDGHYQYDCRVDVPCDASIAPYVGCVTLAPGFQRCMAEDADEAFRRIAEAAVSFATYDREDLTGYANHYERNGEHKAVARKANRWR